MALKKGNNPFQISFQFLEGKRFCKSNLISGKSSFQLWRFHSVSCDILALISILIENFSNSMGQMNQQIFQIKEEHNLIYSIRMCCP